MSSIAILTRDGHIALPSDVRDCLGLNGGESFEVQVREDGAIELRLKARPKVEDLLAMRIRVEGNLSPEAIDEGIAEGVAEEFLRSGKT